MVQPLPESVKVARLGFFIESADEKGYAFKIPMGPDEVMLLLAIQYWHTNDLKAGMNSTELTLYRKTDEDPPGGGFDDTPDIIFHVRHRVNFVTESVGASDKDFFVLPYQDTSIVRHYDHI